MSQDPSEVTTTMPRLEQVEIIEVHDTRDLIAVEALFRRVWSTREDRPPINADVLRALAYSGSYVALARDSEGEIAGAAVGFLSRDTTVDPPAPSLHSHIAAVAPGNERRGIGRALKLHQRDFAQRHGLTSITWTFDPLVRRNAAFNASLGVDFVAYHVDFYGAMADAVNAGHGSDRLLARWGTTRPCVACVADDPTLHEVPLLDADASGRPVRGRGTGDRTWVAVPADIESLRLSDPALAKEWRTAVREALGSALGDWVIDGFTPGGRYALRRRHESHQQTDNPRSPT